MIYTRRIGNEELQIRDVKIDGDFLYFSITHHTVLFQRMQPLITITIIMFYVINNNDDKYYHYNNTVPL